MIVVTGNVYRDYEGPGDYDRGDGDCGDVYVGDGSGSRGDGGSE